MLSEEHGGVEVQDYLNEFIYQDESVFVEADKKAAKAAATTVTALAKYEEKAKAHDDAENELYSTIQNSRDLTTAAERAATEARVNHQHAQTAKQRVATGEYVFFQSRFDHHFSSMSESACHICLTQLDVLPVILFCILH